MNVEQTRGNDRYGPIALAIIDMQNDFVLPGAPLCVACALKTVPTIRRLLEQARKNDWHIFHIIREHRPYGVDVERSRVPLFSPDANGVCLAGTRGAEIVDDLRPLPGEYIVRKRRFSAFMHTEFDLVLRRLGVHTLIIAGTQYPNCVRGTAVDAMSLDYEVIVITDACSAQNPEIAASNIRDMRNMNIACIPLAELEDLLRTQETER